MNVLVINGPNLNLLGEREPDVYGRRTLDELIVELSAHAQELGVTLRAFQSNHEGEIIDELHASRAWADAIIINPAAFTHYSYAIRDALLAVAKPAAEVHLSDVEQRAGDFRKISVIRDIVAHRFAGLGFDSYHQALDVLVADYHAAHPRRAER
ncbi:MAG TPA: type II 3-dehydroquinate dehydratase [Candidatus Elarobacter sp.]|jgi:3-dehydroquinate dehydratase-2|nr:type II 3-dehydroquinate dehydratase [Candidatus Elarobacter sp.]